LVSSNLSIPKGFMRRIPAGFNYPQVNSMNSSIGTNRAHSMRKGLLGSIHVKFSGIPKPAVSSVRKPSLVFSHGLSLGKLKQMMPPIPFAIKSNVITTTTINQFKEKEFKEMLEKQP